jgi:hypothetical protein
MNGKAICHRNGLGTTTITGYTRARCCDDNGHQSIFYAHPCYRGSPWYDWAYVHFVDNNEDEACLTQAEPVSTNHLRILHIVLCVGTQY